MNDNGKISQFEDPKLARAAGFNMPLTKAEADKLRTLPESERVAEHVANRHAALALASACTALLPADQVAALDRAHATGYGKGPIPRGKGSTYCPSPRDRAKKRARVSR